MDNWLEEANTIASQVARVVHRKYSVYFDVADVRQELLVWVWRREDKVRTWLDHSQGAEIYKGGVKQLGKTLTRQAEKYCRREKAQKLGYALEDELYYSPITLSELLPFIWGDVLETKRQDGEKVSGSGNPAEGGNYVIQLIDIRWALGKLDEADRYVLELKFRHQFTFAEMAEQLQISDTTAHRKLDGAIRRLNQKLGGTNPLGKGEDVEASKVNKDA